VTTDQPEALKLSSQGQGKARQGKAGKEGQGRAGQGKARDLDPALLNCFRPSSESRRSTTQHNAAQHSP
jgi:hypothetical protein